MRTEYLKADRAGDLERAASILKNGGLVGIPTETVYGLAANALDGKACSRIFEAKGRPADNPLIVHISDLSQWEPLVKEIPENARKLAEAYWPGPMTIILPKSERIPPEVSAGMDTVGVRFPSHPIAQKLIRLAGVPLAAPSANLSGHPSPTTAQHVWEDMAGRIEAVLDGGICDVGLESTVLSLAVHPPRLFRPGGVTPEQLKAVLGELEVDPAVTQPLAAGVQAASPGMKYRHYAPKARVSIVDGNRESYLRFVNSQADGRTAALCYEEDEAELQIPCVSYGKETDEVQQAQELFEALRKLDELGVDRVYARCPAPEGVGLAVYNRLIRAAGFEVIRVD